MKNGAWLLSTWRGLVVGVLFIGLSSIPGIGQESASQPSPSALVTDPSGWEDILPATDLKGWIRVPIPITGKLIRQQWHVDQGTLVCDGDGGHDMLLLDRKFRNCIFHVEFCLAKIEGKQGYNSGIFIRTSANGAVWHQAQVGSLNGGYWFGASPDGGTTKRFHINSLPCRVMAAGEWNTFELTAKGSNLTLWVNGFPCTPFNACGLDEGYLGLEGEGSLITFRNLKVKVLP